MNNFVLIVCIVFDRFVIGSTELGAVTDMPSEYAQHVYKRVRNEDPPSVRDVATGNPLSRQRICEDVFGSGVFMASVLKMEEMFDVLEQPQYSELFHQIYRPTEDPLHPFEYWNSYRRRKLETPLTVNRILRYFDSLEYVFMCPVWKSSVDDITIYYVSKEYNLLAVGPYTAGRFIFGDKSLPKHEILKLAEEPATVLVAEKREVEMHYIRIRKHHRSEMEDNDPVCRLLSREPQHNQYHRICTKVLSSPHFRAQINNLIRQRSSVCSTQEVSFRTPEGIAAAAGKSYHERMISCYTSVHSGNMRVYYISRAYESHKTFVYVRYPPGSLIYLENLAINVNMVKEPFAFNFDDVE